MERCVSLTSMAKCCIRATCGLGIILSFVRSLGYSQYPTIGNADIFG
ncbi:MAG: hypothetical protein ACI932_001845 [Paracoccaceae bacterium]